MALAPESYPPVYYTWSGRLGLPRSIEFNVPLAGGRCPGVLVSAKRNCVVLRERNEVGLLYLVSPNDPLMLQFSPK